MAIQNRAFKAVRAELATSEAAAQVPLAHLVLLSTVAHKGVRTPDDFAISKTCSKHNEGGKI